MGVGKKAKAVSKKSKSRPSPPPQQQSFDMFVEFNSAVADMNSGRVLEAAHAFAKCFAKAKKAIDERPTDAEEMKIQSIQEIMFECLAYRAACLQASQYQPAFQEAQANLEAAVQISIDLAQPDMTCQALDLLATAQNKVYNHEGCLESAEKLLTVSVESMAVMRFKVSASLHKGRALIGLGRYQEAMSMLSDVHDAVTLEGDQESAIKVCDLLARAFLGVAKVEEARRHAEQALEIAQKIGSKASVVAEALETLGIVCLEAGEAPEAAESLARAMTMQERETSESTVATTTKLRIGDGRRILYRVHAFILMSDWPTAEAHLEGAIKVAQSQRDEVLGAAVLYTAGCLHAAKGEIHEGIECFEKSAAVAATQKCYLLELNSSKALNNLIAANTNTDVVDETYLKNVSEKKAIVFPEYLPRFPLP